MRLNRRITTTLYGRQLALLNVLEQLEIAAGNHSCQCRPGEIPPVGMQQSLTRVTTALQHNLLGIMIFEEVRLLPLLNAAGETALLAELQWRRDRLQTLSQRLLKTATGLLSSPPASFGPDDDPWELLDRDTVALSSQLIRYLHRAENEYLPLLEYLLSESADRQLTTEFLYQQQQSWTVGPRNAPVKPRLRLTPEPLMPEHTPDLRRAVG